MRFRSGINNYATRPPHSLTDALGREIERYDQLCDTVEAHLVSTPFSTKGRAVSSMLTRCQSRAIAVLQRDLDQAKAQEKAEREAEALRNMPPPEPEVVAVSSNRPELQRELIVTRTAYGPLWPFGIWHSEIRSRLLPGSPSTIYYLVVLA